MSIRMMTAAVAVVAALALGAGPAAAVAPAKHFEGTVVSKDKASRSFRLQGQAGVIRRIKVTGSTTFERLAGFSAIKVGNRIEANARKRDGRWIAIKVSRPGGGGGGGADDGPNHT